jgi:hypothetical protein
MGQIRPSSGSQPTVAMPSVAEADHAEFAETAATLAPQIERFFYTRERSGGPNFPSTVPTPRGAPARMCPPLSQRWRGAWCGFRCSLRRSAAFNRPGQRR